jgi:transposase InsO family protein
MAFQSQAITCHEIAFLPPGHVALVIDKQATDSPCGVPVEKSNDSSVTPWHGIGMTHHQHDETRAQSKAAIQEYIGILYNRQRRHSRLGYQPPAVFAQPFKYLRAA